MLGLKLPTDPRWVNIAEKSIGEILTDHAYCEQKAASNAISLIVKYPEKKEMLDELSSLVAEEWGHFRKVIAELDKRGLALGRQRKDDYVVRLSQFTKKGGSRNSSLLEQLLLCALIEARSCERFRLLSLHISDESLKEFYHGFMVSEAGHYRMFIDLARLYAPEEVVKVRWEEFLAEEAKILGSLELRGDRMH